MYYLPILYFYLTYTIFSPFINPITNKFFNYTIYKISNLELKNKLKNFNLNNITAGDKLLVYTVNDSLSKKIITKLQHQIQTNSDKFIFGDKNTTDFDSEYIIINSCNSFNDISNISKFDLDYIIINCDKHIIYTESVFEEFFKYTGLDKNEFIKLYNKYENIVLDLNQNEILTFT